VHLVSEFQHRNDFDCYLGDFGFVDLVASCVIARLTDVAAGEREPRISKLIRTRGRMNKILENTPKPPWTTTEGEQRRGLFNTWKAAISPIDSESVLSRELLEKCASRLYWEMETLDPSGQGSWEVL
jgi:hypothetical protein